MKTVFFVSACCVFCVVSICGGNTPVAKDASGPVASKLWATDPVFETPESVIWDAENGMLYVANILGKPAEKDGNGFISRLGLNGEIKQLKWVEGLHAPKGMGIYEGKLFVTDVDRVVEISIREGKIVKEYPSKKAKFLNDIAVSPSGVVCVSDSMANLVFYIREGKLEPWLDGPELKAPNGLFAEQERLLIGNQGYVLGVDYRTKKITRFIEDTDYIDGLEYFRNGAYLASNWRGAVYVIHPGKKKIKILDTSSEKIQAADIEYVPGKNLLLVPTFHDGRVVAYQLSEKK